MFFVMFPKVVVFAGSFIGPATEYTFILAAVILANTIAHPEECILAVFLIGETMKRFYIETWYSVYSIGLRHEKL